MLEYDLGSTQKIWDSSDVSSMYLAFDSDRRIWASRSRLKRLHRFNWLHSCIQGSMRRLCVRLTKVESKLQILLIPMVKNVTEMTMPIPISLHSMHYLKLLRIPDCSPNFMTYNLLSTDSSDAQGSIIFIISLASRAGRAIDGGWVVLEFARMMLTIDCDKFKS